MSNQPGQPNKPGQPTLQVEQAKALWSGMTRGRQVATGATGVGLLFTLFPWRSYSIVGVSSSTNAWQAGLLALLAILGLLVAGLVVLLPALGRPLRQIVPSLPPAATDARLVQGAGAVTALATLLFVLTTGAGGSAYFSAGPSVGAFVDLLCGVALAAGGYLMQSEPQTL